ncbi:hypothetical protein GCM10011511_15070 [Puia dinghuensis]|uniref:Uncharacterized protein n=1 Tax=Puia dinghuensis TaxID=1792502 RepID=A0A8J2XSQ3_9BACT|nr:hypothetical protein GCM10011511_15070 [Puia dinghuensis]
MEYPATVFTGAQAIPSAPFYWGQFITLYVAVIKPVFIFITANAGPAEFRAGGGVDGFLFPIYLEGEKCGQNMQMSW